MIPVQAQIFWAWTGIGILCRNIGPMSSGTLYFVNWESAWLKDTIWSPFRLRRTATIFCRSRGWCCFCPRGTEKSFANWNCFITERAFYSKFAFHIVLYILGASLPLFQGGQLKLLESKSSNPTYYRQPESRNVYICMGAKNKVQPAVPIRPGFACRGSKSYTLFRSTG